MEMFQPQPCSALATLVKLSYLPPFPPKQCCILIPQTSSYIQVTLNGGGGHVNDEECGRHRSVILHIIRTLQEQYVDFDADYSLLKTFKPFMLCDSPSTIGMG